MRKDTAPNTSTRKTFERVHFLPGLHVGSGLPFSVFTCIVTCHAMMTILRERNLRLHDASSHRPALVEFLRITYEKERTNKSMADVAVMIVTTTEPMLPEHLVQVLPRLDEYPSRQVEKSVPWSLRKYEGTEGSRLQLRTAHVCSQNLMCHFSIASNNPMMAVGILVSPGASVGHM